MYIYDISGTPRLEKILTASDRTILSVAWNPHDPNSIAMAIAEEEHNLLVWDLHAEAVSKRLSAVAQPAKFVAWSVHHTGEIVSSSLHGVITRSTTFGARDEVPWVSHAEGKISSASAKGGATHARYESERGHAHDASKPRVVALRVSTRVPTRYALAFDSGLLLVLTNGAVTLDAAHKRDPISDAQWDPLSDGYLLVGFSSGTLHMYDVESKAQLQTFDKQPGLTMIAWMPGVPGDFVTASDKAGVLRVWNVSHRAPTDTIKAEAGPLQAISFIEPTPQALCRFKSGAVGLCDVSRRSWTMFGRAAHTDTVFAAAFKPADPNMLATCSFDGSVRIWDTRHSSLHRDLVGDDVGVLYAVCWAPHDETRLCTTSSRGQVHIWDVDNGVLHHRVQLSDTRTPAALFSVHWGAHGLITAAGHDGIVHVLSSEGQPLVYMKHPMPCYDANWHPTDPNLLATSCADKLVRIWHMKTDGSGLPRGTSAEVKLSGHTQKVFGVLWSPLLPDVLLSGSDDTTVRVWDTRAKTNRALLGHTKNVRALHWSFEVPWLAFSGSWDGTIRVWDTRSCTAVAVLTDHHADVYAIVSHPSRPAVLLSTSRDTTIRTWSLSEMLSAVFLPLVLAVNSAEVHSRNGVGALVHALTGDVQAEVNSPHSLPQACCGAGARALAAKLQAVAGTASRIELLSIVFDFFYPPRGMSNLWLLLAKLLGDGAASPGSHLGVSLAELEVSSEGDLIGSAQSMLTALIAEKDRAASRMVGEGVNRRRIKQEDRLRMAAALSCSLGQMEQYCELLVQLGEWANAIAVAPAVSLDYWRQLCARHADQLAERSAESALVAPYMIAAGATSSALHYMIARQEYHDAATLATSHAAGMLPLVDSGSGGGMGRGGSVPQSPPQSPSGSAHNHGGFATRLSPVSSKVRGGGAGVSSEVLMVAEARARMFQDEGEPVLAACCFLAHGETSRAMDELLRTHQLEVALALALALNVPALQPLLLMLAARAERLGEATLSVDLLQRTRDPMAHIALLAARAARAPSLAAPPPDLYAYASLPPAASYLRDAETAQRGGNVAEAVRCYIVCGDLRAAAELALPPLALALGGDNCDLATAQTLLEPIRQTALDDASALGGSSSLPAATRCALLGWSAYEAAMHAMWRGYSPVVMPLLRAVQELTSGAAAGAPHAPTDSEVDGLTMQVYAYFQRAGTDPELVAALALQLDVARAAGRLSPQLTSAFTALSAAGPPIEPPRMLARPISVRGSELASSSGGRASSFFTGARISGPMCALEDGATYVSMSDAVMWAMLHPFSPTHSGARLNPF